MTVTWTKPPTVLIPATKLNTTLTLSIQQQPSPSCSASSLEVSAGVWAGNLAEPFGEVDHSLTLGWAMTDGTPQPLSKVMSWDVPTGNIGDVIGYVISYTGVRAYMGCGGPENVQYNYTYQANVTNPVVTNPELSDLSIDNKYIYMGRSGNEFSNVPDARDKFYSMREISADQQAIGAVVFNKGKNEAKNVYVQFSVQYPGRGEYTPLGDPILVGDIPADGYKGASMYWDLGGKNIEGAALLARAYIPGEDDLNPDDNSAGVQVNIYYANKDDRTYSWTGDTYSFVNYNFSGRETEELIEGFLATVVGNIGSEQMAGFSKAIKIQKALATTFAGASGLQADQELLHRLIFPQSYIEIKNYMNESMKMGSGGHCYGMSATSALYFEDPSLKPINKLVKDMTLEEASANIAIYHRAQMLPLYGALLTGGSEFFSRNNGPVNCYQALKDSLSGDRMPLIIEFFGKNAGHAVLGYKLVEIDGQDPFVYIYDPNFPVARVKPNFPMPQITLQVSQNNWANPGYMGYNWANAKWISAQKPRRTISLTEVNAIVPTLKKSIYDYVNLLKGLKKFIVEARCPADAVFTDSQGRRTGTLNGQVVNEIPGAEVLSEGEVEIYRLPSEEKYSVAIKSTSKGQLGFDVIRADGDSAALVSFQNISLESGVQIAGNLEVGGKIEALQSGTKVFEPSIMGSLDMTGFGTVVEGNPIPTNATTISQPTGPVLAQPVAPKTGAEKTIKPGSIWNVKEYGPMGNWDEEWVVREDGQTIDASWSGGSITDIIDIKSIQGDQITLYRHGNRGYYTGTISPDGRSMSGTASWYSPGETWTATLANSTAVGPLNKNLTYNGHITKKAFQFSGWGYYKAIDNQDRTYFAGYDSGYLYTNSRAKTLPNDQAALVLVDNGTEEKSQITITSANPLKLAEGYQLTIKSIDVDGNKAYLELSKNGQVVDSKVVQPSIDNAQMSDQTYYYKTSLGDTKDIIQIAVHFKNAFHGADTNIASIDGVFQISDTVTPLTPQNSLSPESNNNPEKNVQGGCHKDPVTGRMICIDTIGDLSRQQGSAQGQMSSPIEAHVDEGI